jgi:two-component system, NarL family, response regulator LiaR
MAEKIDVLLIDDHRMFSDALELLLQGEESLNMIGAAGNAEDALEMCKERCPGVVLMDIDLPGMDGIQATRRVKQICPEAQVVIITALQQPEPISRAIEAGACGYVPKTHAADQLVGVIRRAAEGDMILPSGEIAAILDRLRQSRRARSEAEQVLGQLSSREIQILQALSEAKSTSEVAASLFISPLTVQSHVKSILGKLGVRSKLEAVMMALRHGVIGPAQPGEGTGRFG